MWLAGDILLKADKMSMAHSLELRVPFLDKEVFALAAALPDDDYTYDEVRMTLTGRRTKAVWSFGMPLEVVCAAADPGSGQIDFALPEGAAPARPVEARQAPVKPSRRSAKTGNKPGYRPPKRTKGRRKR